MNELIQRVQTYQGDMRAQEYRRLSKLLDRYRQILWDSKSTRPDDSTVAELGVLMEELEISTMDMAENLRQLAWLTSPSEINPPSCLNRDPKD